MKSRTLYDVCLFGFGGLLVAVGLGLGLAWPGMFQKILHSNLLLSNNSKSYNMWVKTPLPMYLDIYLFNCTNSDEFIKNPSKVKPIFEEVGPFVFEEVHERVNVTWNDDGTVSYNQTRKWTYVPEVSVPLNSSITNLDLILLTVSYATKNFNLIERAAIDLALKSHGTVFTTHPASEWLFDGMDLPMLDFLEKYKKWIPFPVPADKFGFFYQRNMSAAYDGRFKVLTGQNELTDLGMLVEWNNANRTAFFPDTCGRAEGSSGEIFPPTSSEQKTFTLFVSDVCSALKLKYARKRYVEGVLGREFVGDETMFGNNASIPEQECFCQGACQPAGVRNMTSCRQGAPVFVSFPHFYSADSSYLEGIEGLSPNKSLHEFRLTLDPMTGIPLDVRAQIQVNVLLENYANYGLYKNLPRLFIPVLWFSQRAAITPSLASQALLLLSVNSAAFSIAYVVLAIGALMVVIRFWLRHKTTVSEEQEPIIPAAEGLSS